MYTAGTCQPSVASAQCLPLAAPTRPAVAADGGDWHHVVSCPATWVPHWGWRGRGLPVPTPLSPLKCPPRQPASPCSLCSACPTCQLSTAPSALHSANESQHCQGAAEQARRRGTRFCALLLSCLLEVHTCPRPPKPPLPNFRHQLMWHRHLNPSPFP